jgi:alpha/beta superfamily hydrolase
LTAGEAGAQAVWFGPEDRPLFGWVHTPAVSNGVGVVLCPSIGAEGENSQFAFRELAPALAASGCIVVRFDYDGTGDSAGTLADPGRVDAWLGSIREAVALAREAGAGTVDLVGIRLGAALAAYAASDDGAIRSLTSWYPMRKGSHYVRYQQGLRRLYPNYGALVEHDGLTEIPGFVLDRQTTEDLRTIDARSEELVLPAATLVIDSAGPPAGELPEGTVWMKGTGESALFGYELTFATVAPEEVEAIVGFVMGQRGPDEVGPVHPAGRSSAVVGTVDGRPIVERPVTLGKGLFGILTEAGDPPPGSVDGTGRGRPRFAAAIFLNSGSIHHIGPSRQWVEMSRAWAPRGVRCLRLDLGGIGDSQVTGESSILSSYPPSAIDDVDAAMQFLAPGDPGAVVLVGLCSGAYHGLLAGSALHSGGVVAINPLRYPSLGEGDSELEGNSWEAFQLRRAEMAADAAPEAAAVRPRRGRLGELRDRGVFQPLTSRLPDWLWRMTHPGLWSEGRVEAVRRVVDRGVDVYLVCGTDEWQLVGRGNRKALRSLKRTGRFESVMVPSLDHSLHIAAGRDEVVAHVGGWELDGGVTGPTPHA